jgi:hypothetical protein
LDAGEANSAVPDPEVLAFAVEEGRILLTHNRLHFLRIGAPHKSVTQLAENSFRFLFVNIRIGAIQIAQ